MEAVKEKVTETRVRSTLNHVLFYTRLFLYLLAFTIPVFHPAVVVPYDRFGWWLWFAVLPVEMLIAFYGLRLGTRAWLIVAALPIAVTVIFVSGFSPFSLAFLGVGAASFIVTAAIFHGGPWGRWIALPEPFLLAVLYYKMLSFTRASEAIAHAAAGVTQLLLVISICAFLLHSLVLYFAVFRAQGEKRRRRELILFASIVVPIVVLVAVLLPSNFVSNSIIFNTLDHRVRPKPVPIDATGKGLPGGNLQSPRNRFDQGESGRLLGRQYLYGDGTQPGQQPGDRAALEGIPSDQWQSGQMGTGSKGQAKQYAVMVIASPMDPIYAAEGYFARFNPVAGFERTPDQPLNELVNQRLLETWQDPETSEMSDAGRVPVPVYYLSTLPERVLAYRPYTVEPTVLDRKYYPFNYSYTSVSMISDPTPQGFRTITGLTPQEKQALAPYLRIPLSPEDRAIFEHYLQSAINGQTGYFVKIMAILKSFSTFQYQVGFSDNTSVQHLVDFLTTTKNGDCVEFSNTTAILARLAGIPSRVVTGYLAAKDLQTPAHRRGVELLRQKIPALRKFPLSELYLVTTALHHSWVQLYMPGYGWVDFETTAYAIPPQAGGDPNNWDVVIPLLENQELAPLYHFPWYLVLRLLAVLTAGVTLLMYLYRYGRELFLLNLSRGKSRRSLDALYKLLLLRLVTNGFALKSPATTPIEYAEDHPELTRFASLYTELKYRELYGAGERELLWKELKREYRETVRQCRKTGFLNFLRRGFSLKGLYYRW